VRRVITTLALALSLLGCGSSAPSGSAAPSVSAAPAGEPIELRTGVDPDLGPERSDGLNACRTFWNVGLLIVDADFGTAAEGNYGIKPLIWPLGYTARRLAGGEVVVLNRTGDVVATTGHKYQFWTVAWGGGGPAHTGFCVNEWNPDATPAL